MNEAFAQLVQFFLQYSLKQRLIISGILIAFLSIVFTLVMWSNRTEYDLLFANLDPQDASEIVTGLSADKIKYRLETGGTTIYVQQDMVDELRIKYHDKNGGTNSPQGWDKVFEPGKANLGETSTMQRMKIIRAQEGELETSINMITWVRNSRVHLNIPERRLFEDDRRGSASVILNLKTPNISEIQLKSIPSMVSHSVDGISEEDVSVVDAHGNLLYNGEEGSSLGETGTQWELTKQLEKDIKVKVRNLVETNVGYGNASVQVGVELNFDQVKKTIKDINPDDVTVLSEEIINENSNDNTDSSAATTENSTTNYEFSKVVSNIVQGVGTIKRLSVSVLVNGKYQSSKDANGEALKTYVPLVQNDLNNLTQLVKAAIGFDEKRGDIVSVINMRFADKPVYESSFLDNFKDFDIWKQLITYILIAIGLFMGFTLVKGFMNSDVTNKILLPFEVNKKSLSPAHSRPKLRVPEEEEELSEDLYISKLSPEARAKIKAKDKMTQSVISFANEHPEQATSLLRGWLTKEKM